MSLMAGFDCIAEISNAALLKLIKSKMEINGVTVNPPFELSIDFSGMGVTGNGHFIVNDLLLDLHSDDTITLTLGFNNTSIITKPPLALAVAALDGNLTIRAAISLASGGMPFQEVLAVELGTAIVAINFSPAAQTKILAALVGTPLTLANFLTYADNTLQAFIQKMGSPTFPIGFSVEPGVEGKISPSLQFEQLQVHCIANADRGRQALIFFGILLLMNHGKGDHTQKTETAIPPGHDFSISIAPGAFHWLIFCPQTATALTGKSDLTKLPDSCGHAKGLDNSGATIRNISDTFRNGYIQISGLITQSGRCYDASVSFSSSLTLDAVGTELKPHFTLDFANPNVTIQWYCIAAAIVGAVGPILIGFGFYQSTVYNQIKDGVVSSLTDFGKQLSPTSLSAFSNTSLETVSITSEGLTISGDVQVTLVAHQPRLALSGSVMTTSTKVLGNGTYSSTTCPQGDWPYTELAHQQLGTYQAIPTLLGQPLILKWELYTEKDVDGSIVSVVSVPLAGNSGTVALPAQTNYMFPLPAGASFLQTVHIGYTISGDIIQLTNVPTEGNFGLSLVVTATDPLGNVKVTGTDVQFEGNAVIFSPEYYKQWEICARGIIDKIREEQSGLRVLPRVPRWVPADHPAPAELINLIRAVAVSGVPEANELLALIKLAHGASFNRALFSSAPIQVRLSLKESS